MENNNDNILEIEEAILGLILSNEKLSDSISQIFLFLDFDYFSNKPNQEMFKMFSHFEKNKIYEFDMTIIKKYINENNLSKVITIPYINKLISNAGYLSQLNYYQNAINENHSKEKIKKSLKDVLKNIDDIESKKVIESVRNDLSKIEERKFNTDFISGAEVAKKVISDALSGKKEIIGLKTGFLKLDSITTGLQNGDLIILAARPSVGKTAFALNLAMNVIVRNKSVAFFSLEMPAEQLMQRMISSLSYVNNYKFKEPTKLIKEEKEKILAAFEKIKDKKLFIDDSGSIKLDEIIWKSRKLKEKEQLDLIIIDYMQLIPTDSWGGGNRQQEVSKISRSLKQLARELDVPIIALSQLNRRVEERESKKPMMSDLRESGSIEQDADIIAFLYREDYYNKNHANEETSKDHLTELNIAKHRNGTIGVIQFTFDSSIGRFREFNNDPYED